MEHKSGKRVGILIGYGWLSVSPSLVSTIRMLSGAGYLVDVIDIYDKQFERYKPETDKVMVNFAKPGKSERLNIILNTFYLLKASLRYTQNKKYAFFIGVDLEGIVVAGILGKRNNVPYIYYSLEILSKTDIAEKRGLAKLIQRYRKTIEVYFSKKAKFTIVQDEDRADILTRDNSLRKDKILLVPNSYYPIKKSGSYNGVQLPKNKTIVIYAGSIQPEMAIGDIIESLRLWPDDTLLMLHTPYATPYLREIRELIKENDLESKVIISVKSLDFEDLFALIRVAHIGISFYKPVDDNYKLCPSGKTSFYLSEGLPVIVNNLPPSEKLIDKWKCGVCVSKYEAVGEAIQTITKNYEEFSASASACYKQEFEFSRHFNNVLENLKFL